MVCACQRWKSLSESSVGEEILIDTAKANKKYSQFNPYTVLQGSCHIPRDASEGLKQAHMTEMGKTFIGAMEKKGYTLSSPLRFQGPFAAFELETNVPLLEQHEWRMKGLFKQEKLEPVRIELDPDIVKQDEEHSLTADQL